MYSKLTKQSDHAKQPRNMALELKKHQLACISAMRKVEYDGGFKGFSMKHTEMVENSRYRLIKEISVPYVEEGEEGEGGEGEEGEEGEGEEGDLAFLSTDIGFLGDRPGAGKTYVAIGAMCKNIVTGPRTINFSPTFKTIPNKINGSNVSKVVVLKESKLSLVIVCHTLINQWIEAFEKAECDLNVSSFNVQKDMKNLISTVPFTEQELQTNAQRQAYYEEYMRMYERDMRKYEQDLQDYEEIRQRYREEMLSSTPDNALVNRLQMTQGPRKPIEPRKPILIKQTTAVCPNLLKKFIRKQKTDVVLINSNTIKMMGTALESIHWGRIFIDELNGVYSCDLGRYKYNFCWILTATFTYQQTTSSRTKKYPCLNWDFNTQYAKVACLPSYINQSMGIIPPLFFVANYMASQMISGISNLGFISDKVSDMLIIGDISGAIQELSGSAKTTNDLMAAFTISYKTKRENLDLALSKINSNHSQYRNIVQQIKECNEQEEAIKIRMTESMEDTCMICADDITIPTVMSCCHRVYCLDCINKCYKIRKKCPLCNAPMTQNMIHVINNNKKNKMPAQPLSNYSAFNTMQRKNVIRSILLQIKRHDPEPKILFFSLNDRLTDQFAEYVDDINLSSIVLAGTNSSIKKRCKMFAKGKVDVLMMNSVSAAAGLNLDMANYVILTSRMTIDIERQIIGRAQRYPRSKPLKVIYIISTGENIDQVPYFGNDNSGNDDVDEQNCTSRENIIDIKDKNDLSLIIHNEIVDSLIWRHEEEEDESE